VSRKDLETQEKEFSKSQISKDLPFLDLCEGDKSAMISEINLFNSEDQED
jgi:hypothetical protein